jgi:hypothetical protein
MTTPRIVVLTREHTFHHETDGERTLRPGGHVMSEAFEASARGAGAVDEAATAAANPVRKPAAKPPRGSGAAARAGRGGKPKSKPAARKR